ncbi:MAG: hypothetical protein JWR50_3124, partial [Mucilaginibacter sp.]|nr:hypothetical protein [Mucilaginibacter sp.]
MVFNKVFGKKAIAMVFLFTIINQIISPSVAFALTAGPTAPEATNFEPIDTTDTVNPLTGEFTYNLPLLSVPGPEGDYPLSLSYHAGIRPDEEASWVGLGWSLNPGAIARNVNGYPDDWKYSSGTVENYWSGGQSKTYSFGVSVGISNVASVGFGLAFAQDTYRGFGVGYSLNGSLGIANTELGLSATIGISPYGDPYAGAGIAIQKSLGGNFKGSLGLSVQTNFQSISADVGAGISVSRVSLLGASIGTANTHPSGTIGGGTFMSAVDANIG